MKNKSALIVFLVILLLGGFIFYKIKTTQAKDDKKAAPPKPSVSNVTGLVIHPVRLDNTVTATGTVLANNEVDLHPEIAGRIVKLYFKEGSHVTKGELLVKINDADLRAQLEKLDYQLKLYQSQLVRNKKLLDKEGISQAEYDVALNQVDATKADMTNIRAQIAKTEIRAPFTGVVGLRYVSEGSFVTLTARIATLQEINPVRIDFAIPEKYMAMVKKGDQIKFTVQGAAGTFSGNIFAIEPKIDLATRTILMRASCPNEEAKLLPGAYARINLILGKTENALMVPTEAVIPILKGQTVYLMNNGKAKKVNIDVGMRNDSTTEVTSGLHAGDTVITTGIMYLRPDIKVNMTKVK